jgi:hypothetical protein
MFLLGAALVVSALAQGGGPLSTGVVFGLLLAAAGAGRFLLTRGDREG